MDYPDITITDAQRERMKACWSACDGIPTRALEHIKVLDLITVIKSVRETLGCAKTFIDPANGHDA